MPPVREYIYRVVEWGQAMTDLRERLAALRKMAIECLNRYRMNERAATQDLHLPEVYADIIAISDGIESEVSTLLAGALEAAANVCDDHAEELIAMIGKPLPLNYDSATRDRLVKDQAYTARICGQRIRAITSTDAAAALNERIAQATQPLREALEIAIAAIGYESSTAKKIRERLAAEARKGER